MPTKTGISVIIPYYEARDTIIRCLDSLVTDVLDVEVILVDDASTKGCLDIVENYKNSRKLDIKYYRNKVNLGAGESRNRAISEVTKEYLTFLDSDDEFSDEYFDVLQPIMLEGYDAIVYDARRRFQNKESIMKMFFSRHIHEGEVDYNAAVVYTKGCTCGKIYKTCLIKKEEINFGRTKINEDLVFTKVALSYCRRIYYREAALYVYNDNENSLMNSSNWKKENDINAFNSIKCSLRNRGFEKELNSIYYIEILYSIPNGMLSKDLPISEIREYYRKLKESYKWRDKYKNNYDMWYRVAVLMYDFGFFRLYWVLRTGIKIHLLSKKQKVERMGD